MALKLGLGFHPHYQVALNGAIDQTSKLEVNKGTGYNVANGNSFNTRVVVHRLYVDMLALKAGLFGANSNELYSHNSGHVVMLSTGVDTKDYAGISAFLSGVIGGDFDAAYIAFFNKVQSLQWGPSPVLPIKDGNGKFIPGSEFGGTKPTELVYCFVHEPNIASSNGFKQKLDPTQYAQAYKHVMTLYDNQHYATPRIKFATIISGNSLGAAHDYHGIGTSYDISGTGTRPVDYPGWDLYFPRTQANDNTKHSPPIMSFSNKFGILLSWLQSSGTSYGGKTGQPRGGGFGSNTPAVIGEYAARLPTINVGSYDPVNWYTDLGTYLNNNTLTNGDHPVKYMCQFCSTTKNSSTGGTDNSIIPDQTTIANSYESGNQSLRPNYLAYYNGGLQVFGNPSLIGTTPGVPTALGSSGVTTSQATLSWTAGSNDVTYGVYRDGVKFTTVGTTSLVVAPLSGDSRPVIHSYSVSGISVSGQESAPSTPISVTFPTTGPGAPSTPTGLAQGSTTTTSVVVTCSVPSGSPTGYQWFLDGSGTSFASSTVPQILIQNLSPGSSHTVKVLAFNTSGSSAQSSPLTINVPAGADTTDPTIPTGLTTTGSTTYNVVHLQWNASTDPTVAGQVTSGVQGYNVYRSLSATPGSGSLLKTLSGTSFADTSPINDPLNVTINYYQVTAIDGAGNESDPSAVLAVSVPVKPLPAVPTPVVNFDLLTGLVFGQTATFDATGSFAGTGGAIVSYSWDFGDGTQASGAVAQHAFSDSVLSPEQFNVVLTLVDAANNTVTLPIPLIINPSDNEGILPFSNGGMMVKGAPPRADDVNTTLLALDASTSGVNDSVTGLASIVNTQGNPFNAPSRNGGAIFMSNNLGGNSAMNVSGNTAYVMRIWIQDGSQFSSIMWSQPLNTVSTVTNAFFALYDIAGNLVSPTGALTNAATLWQTANINTYTFDGGPYSTPMGQDDASNPTNEFFLYFYLATIGATAPQIVVSSTSGVINMGTTITGIVPDGTAATLQMCPLFGTASNTPTTALNAPATLGTITAIKNAFIIGLYP